MTAASTELLYVLPGAKLQYSQWKIITAIKTDINCCINKVPQILH